jgi:LAO/AO transport system kinase
LTQVENNPDLAQEVVSNLYKETGYAHIIGVTGPPGSGKSTLVNGLALEFRKRDQVVAIVAVDPSSPFTGGALLGDRVRMRDLAGDPGIFIRSMASRGSLGGLASATGDVVKVLDAAGFQSILVETVGAGQAEVDIATAAHTTLVIEAPGMGDDIQTIKAGILEIADILIVNKMDRPGGDRTVKALQMMLHMGSSVQRVNHHGQQMTLDESPDTVNHGEDAWQIPLLETIAAQNQGIDEVAEKILAHKRYLQSNGGWLDKEIARCRNEIDRMLKEQFIRKMGKAVPIYERESIIEAVAKREIDPYAAVKRLYKEAFAN